jgi:MoxR-like ATPase
VRFALQFTRLTRREKGEVPDFIDQYVGWGAGPRASQFLVLGAKARAALHGRYFATCDDVRSVALPVLRHRIMTNFTAESEGVKPDDVVARLINELPPEESEALDGGKLPHLLGSGDRR